MKFLYSIGNKKIGRDTLIFNMGPATSCPSRRLGLCPVANAGKLCYALKAEKLYPACLPYRRKQALYWQKKPGPTIAADILTALSRHKAVKFIRINESGDFYSQKSADKLFEIARRIRGARPDVVLYIYTARRDLDLSGRPDNLIIQGSGFMVDNAFIAVRDLPPGGRSICPGDCRACNLCKVARGISIFNKYH